MYMTIEFLLAIILIAVYLVRFDWLSQLMRGYEGRLVMITLIIGAAFMRGILSAVLLFLIYIVSSGVVEGNDPKAKVPKKTVPNNAIKKAGRVDTEDKMRKKSDPKLKEDPKANVGEKKNKVKNSLSPIKEGFSLLY
jgi:hypothetical protein